LADLLVLASSNPACSSSDYACAFEGTYDANVSSSYDYYSGNFSISFNSGASTTGDYATEDVMISGTTIEGMQFAIGYQGDLTCKEISFHAMASLHLNHTLLSSSTVTAIYRAGAKQ